MRWLWLVLLGACGTTSALAPPPPAARVAEVEGRWREAWDAWCARVAAQPALVNVKLLSLVDRVALTPADLDIVSVHPELAEVTEQVAARLHDQAALDAARDALGARYDVAADGVARTIRAGWLSGASRYHLTPPPGVVEVRGDVSFVVRQNGKVLSYDRSRALLPATIRIASDGQPLDLETEPSAVLRVLLHGAPADDARDVDGFDRAVADGDITRADAALQSIPRGGAWDAIVDDAERRFAAIDTTRPAELLETPATVIVDVPTSCAAREAWLVEHNEALRYRPAEVARAAEATPALVGSCVRAALQAGDLLLDTFQLDAAEALAHRLVAQLDAGPETRAAEALLARAARSRGVAPARPVAPADALDLGLPLVDGAALVAAAPPASPGQTVLLDDRYVHVATNGRVTLRTHVVTCAGDAAATEALGELALPSDAELVLARTWRRTSTAPPRALEPEDIVEKDTISLPALVPGDCAEWAWYRELLPDPRLPRGAFLLDPVTFDRADARVLWARLRLHADPGVEPTFAVDTQVDATHPEPRLWVFEARDLAPKIAEPLDPRPALRLVQVTAWGGFERDAWIAKLAADIRPNLRVTPSIERVIARAGPSETPTERLAALHRVVVDAIEQASENPRAANASWAAARGRGERALVLVAACAAVALPCDLVLARPLSEGPDDSGAPDPDGFVYPLVRARLGPIATWLDPSNAHLEPGLIPPLVQDVPAIVISGEPALVTTPRLAEQGERKVTIHGTLAPDGLSVTFTGTEVLSGVYAASWRQALDSIAPEGRQRLFGALVMQAVPGASVDAITIDTDDRYTLTWRWTAHASTESAGGVFRGVKLALLPEALARGTVLVPQRATPLLVNRSAQLVLDSDLTLPTGWLFTRSPPAQATVDHPALHLERTTTLTQDTERASTPARLVIHKTFALAPAVVPPERYAAWKDAALAVDRADYLQIVVAPLPPKPNQ